MNIGLKLTGLWQSSFLEKKTAVPKAQYGGAVVKQGLLKVSFQRTQIQDCKDEGYGNLNMEE